MYNKYLVTGATGFLGRAVVEELARRGAQVHALALPDDPYTHLLPKEVRTVTGDVCEGDGLADFFADVQASSPSPPSPAPSSIRSMWAGHGGSSGNA